MQAVLINHMGSDITVVNSARVSFLKESKWDDDGETDYTSTSLGHAPLSEVDQKLINYLAKHNHYTPFTHVMITMREKVPIFVARQRFKHTVGFSYNEVSRRYVDTPPEFYVPDVWRGKPINAKQGSSDEVVKKNDLIHQDYKEFLGRATLEYQSMLDEGVAPEQARIVLPQSLFTEYYCTGSLAAWARAYKLRSDRHAQKEIQELAKQWDQMISNISELKYSWSALTHE